MKPFKLAATAMVIFIVAINTASTSAQTSTLSATETPSLFTGIWKGTEGVGSSWARVSYTIQIEDEVVKGTSQDGLDLSEINMQGSTMRFVTIHQGARARYTLKLNGARLEGTGITRTGIHFFIILRRVTEFFWIDDSIEKLCAEEDEEYDPNTFECYQGT